MTQTTAETISHPTMGERPKTGPGAISITPRNIRFMKTLPPAATWLGGDIVGTAVFNALSLTFPDGERMFMDAVRAHKSHLSGQLLEDANNFIAQEAIHTREHVSLNKVLDGGHYPLEAIRAHIKTQMEMAEKLGPLVQLFATITLEHFTAMLGDAILRGNSVLEGAPAEVKALWEWHALEETEHKAVAFDVFAEVSKNWKPWRRYMARVQAMIYTTFDFITHITMYAGMLLQADGMGKVSSYARVLWFLFGKPGFFRVGMRGYWSWYKPGFHPWQHDNRALMTEFLARYAPAAPSAA